MSSQACAKRETIGLVQEERATAVTLEDRVQVKDREGRLVFEFIDAENRAVLHVPSGDLEIRADDGEVKLSGSRGISMSSEQDVKIAGRKLDLEGDELQISAARGVFGIGNLVYEGRRLVARVVNASTVADRLETRADRITSGCREMYQTVEGLLSTRASTWRGKVDELFSMSADSVNIRTKEDLTLDGKEIRLG